jgi:hypothetical protein
MEEETDGNFVKIVFQFYSELFEQDMVETLWATIVDVENGVYKLDNIPFYVPLLASEDIIYAEFDENEPDSRGSSPVMTTYFLKDAKSKIQAKLRKVIESLG